MLRSIISILFALAAASAATAATAAPPAGPNPVAPWTEAIVSVRDLDAASRLFLEVGGWTITGRGVVGRDELTYWRLPARASARFLRVCAPAASIGCIRFVRFDGVPQRPIRIGVRPWDTGGIFSIMARTNDAQSVFDRAIALGWWAESEPIKLEFGGSDLRTVVLTGPHGINLALYQRVSPPFTAHPVGPISLAFNSMRMVRDQRKSVAFYRDKLGFVAQFDADYRDPAPQVSNFSLPINLTTSIVRRAAAMNPESGEVGRVELMQFVGLEGQDKSALASPPNLGIVSLRYPVADLAAYAATLRQRGVTPAYAAAKVNVSGIGAIDLIAVRDPDGNITEFYQAPRSRHD